MQFHPMLASQGKLEDLAREDFIFEHKMDGIRCIAEFAKNSSYSYAQITLWSRSGKNITAQFPDVVDQLRASGIDDDLILDGEIICPRLVGSNPHVSNFQVLQTRLQRVKDIESIAIEAPAHFVAFDLLQLGGMSLIDGPLWRRKELLAEICQQRQISTTICMNSVTATLQWDNLIAAGHEGLVAKERNSIYLPGTRSKSWLKIKPMFEGNFIIGGITHGYGRRKGLFGGLVLGEAPHARLKSGTHFGVMEFVGVVGSGLTDVDLARLAKELQPIPISPFLPDPIDNVQHWVDPSHIAKVSYQEWTKDHKLRFPSLISVSRLPHE